MPINFYVNLSMYDVTVEPDSFFSVITKIGGLLGLLRVFALLSAMHEW